MPQPPRRATILEVAREAGVSKTSVSRYYSGERERLSETMRERIVSAAVRLGYQPNPMARGLKGGPSGLVGMLVADIRNPFSVAIMHGVEQACRRAGLSLMVCNSDNDLDQEKAQLALLSSYRIEGLVVNAAGRHSEALHSLAQGGTPLVLLDRTLNDVNADQVGLDNAAAVDMALDHLIERGYGRVLFITEPPALASSRQARLERFQARCATLKLPADTLIAEVTTPQHIEQALDEFQRTRGPRPAILCANGQITQAVVRCVKVLGLAVGEIGLLGIDELDWCDLTDPGITTLAQPTDAIGKAAIDCLRQRQTGSDALPRSLLFLPRLIARGSTQPPLPS
uniref:LacI family DNA-binding transcriptional regulator n=1 Tax=Halomonas sp. TaxID=1486246 RepID=UPI00262AD4BE|nr:LacI family DNA-binding transcriptional regulator [Halomonas sp.]